VGEAQDDIGVARARRPEQALAETLRIYRPDGSRAFTVYRIVRDEPAEVTRHG
jgi:hypothetical protein